MKVVYVSGPIRSKWRIGRWINLWRGRRAAIKLWQAGFAVICPHLNSATLRHHVNEERLVSGDCDIVKVCDFMVMIKGWENSIGCKREHEAARYFTKVYVRLDRAILRES